MPDKKNKKTTDKPAKASKQAKPVVKAAAKAPAKPALAMDRVRYAGEPLAIVVALTQAQAVLG